MAAARATKTPAFKDGRDAGYKVGNEANQYTGEGSNPQPPGP
jgi:hypothetical protein